MICIKLDHSKRGEVNMGSSTTGTHREMKVSLAQDSYKELYYPKCDEKLADRIVRATQRLVSFPELVHHVSLSQLSEALDQGLHNREPFSDGLICFSARTQYGYTKDQPGYKLFAYEQKFEHSTPYNSISFTFTLEKLKDVSKIYYNIRSLWLSYPFHLRIGNATYSLGLNAEERRDISPFTDMYFETKVPQSNQILDDNDFNKLYHNMILNFFKYIDYLQSEGPHPKNILRIYEALVNLNDEELLVCLKQIGAEASSHINFYIANDYLLDFDSVKIIYTSQYPHDKRNFIELDILILELEVGNVDTIIAIQKAYPNLMKSYRFIEYLLVNISHPATTVLLKDLLSACATPKIAMEKPVSKRQINPQTKAKFDLLSPVRRKQSGRKDFFPIEGTSSIWGGQEYSYECRPGWRNYLFDSNCTVEQLKELLVADNAKTKLGKTYPDVATDLDVFNKISASNNPEEIAEDYQAACTQLKKKNIKIDMAVRGLLINNIHAIHMLTIQLIRIHDIDNEFFNDETINTRIMQLIIHNENFPKILLKLKNLNHLIVLVPRINIFIAKHINNLQKLLEVIEFIEKLNVKPFVFESTLDKFIELIEFTAVSQHIIEMQQAAPEMPFTDNILLAAIERKSDIVEKEKKSEEIVEISSNLQTSEIIMPSPRAINAADIARGIINEKIVAMRIAFTRMSETDKEVINQIVISKAFEHIQSLIDYLSEENLSEYLEPIQELDKKIDSFIADPGMNTFQDLLDDLQKILSPLISKKIENPLVAEEKSVGLVSSLITYNSSSSSSKSSSLFSETDESELVQKFLDRYTPGCRSFWAKTNVHTVEMILQHARGAHAGFFGYSGNNTRKALESFGIDVFDKSTNLDLVKQKLYSNKRIL